MNAHRKQTSIKARQQGVALLVMLIVLMGAMAAAAVSLLGSRVPAQRRAQEVQASLAQAREALVAWSIAHPVPLAGSRNRPGGFPCPDNHPPGDPNEGTETYPCAAPGAIGRLPWQTLGIPRPADEHGNTLWYALGGNFRDMPNVAIHSDTVAQYQVYAADGATLLTQAGKEAVAAVFAPGAPVAGQVRDAANVNCPSLGGSRPRHVCPDNYLEATAGRNNASRTGPYVAGDASDTFNDRLLFITKTDFMRQVETRVAREVLYCLTTYSRDPLNQGHLSWLAPLDGTAPPAFNDASGVRFGRMPDPGAAALANTLTDSGGAMNPLWPNACLTRLNAATQWWAGWKERVFVGVARVNQPSLALPALLPWTAAQCAAAGDCLTVCTPGAPCLAGPPADKRVVVIVAGATLAGQSRASNADKGLISNYLEGENASTGDDRFESRVPGSNFNDVVVWQ